MTYRDLQFEFPNRTVLRLSSAGGAVVEFFERDDVAALDPAAHWFSSRGALTWEELTSRLRAVEHWTPITPAPAGLDALTELRARFHAAVAADDAGAAWAAVDAALVLAEVLRIPALSWTPVEAPEVADDAQVLLDGVLSDEPAESPPAVADRRPWLREAGARVRGMIATVRASVKAA